MKHAYEEVNSRRRGRGSIRSSNGNAAASQSPQRPPVARGRSFDEFDGVYQNLRFTNTIASLIGNTVQVQLVDGKVLEGIFTTFSPKFEVVLEVAHEVDPEHPDRIDIKSVEESVVLGLKLIVSMTSKDIDLDYTLKETFLTDSAISRLNGAPKERELEPWDGGNAEDVDLTLDTDRDGWNASEMFQCNERIYKVQTNFEEDLSQYTTKLEKKDTKEYKELEEKASRLASTIESTTSSRVQADLENGSDEEEKFSAVVRPERNGRDTRDVRGHHQPTFDRNQQGPAVHSGNYQLSRRRGGGGGPPGNKMIRSTPSPHGHHAGHYHQGPGSRYQGQSGGPGSYHGSHYDGEGPHRGSHMGHHGYHPRGGYQGPQSRSNFYGRNQNYPSGGRGSGHQGPLEDRRRSSSGSKDVSPSQPSPAAAARPEPARDRRPYIPKSRDDNISEIKKFAQEFRLQEGTLEPKKPSPTPSPSTLSTPSAVTPTSPPSNQIAETTPLSPDSGAGHEELSRPSSEVPATTPEPESKTEDVGKVVDTLKKSNLNPNAKEFVFNPNAKTFTPCSPSTPTPPNSQTPHTPQIYAPGQMGPMGSVVSTFPTMAAPGQGIPVMPAFVMPTYMAGGSPATPMPAHSAANHHYTPMHNSGNYRFRKPVPGGMAHRADLTSPMQVAAATGQPLLAPGPMVTTPFVYPSQSPAPHYTPVYTVRLVTPQGMSVMAANPGSYQESSSMNSGPIFMTANMGLTQTSAAQGPVMATPMQQHPNPTASPAQAHGTPTPQQFMYHSGNPMGPVVFLPPNPGQGPGAAPVAGTPQGIHMYPFASTPGGMTTVPMGMPQYHFIHPTSGPGQPSHMQHVVPQQ